MESTTDFDLEELESRLYSQVFHSKEDWDTQSVPHNANLKLSNVQTRHVSAFTVSNVSGKGNRYCDAKNIVQDKTQNIDPTTINLNRDSNENTLREHSPDGFVNTESTPVQSTSYQQNSNKTDSRIHLNENILHTHNPNESIIIESTTVQSTLCQQNSNNNFPVLESIIPLEISTIQEYRVKPLRYKSHLIPTTLELPKSKAKKIPKNIIKFFNLKSKESFKKFRSFLYYLEKSQNKTNNKTNKTKNDSADQSRIETEILSPKISITTNGIEKKVNLSDIPIPIRDDSVLPVNEELDNYDNDIIILSDSDSDSVIEVPLPPIPVYNVDSSSESEIEETENISYKIPLSPKKNKTKGKKDKFVNPAAQQNLSKGIHNNKNNENNIEAEEQLIDNSADHSLQDSEIHLENINQNHPVDMNVSFSELEKDRDDFLHTPDTNDFLENDVSSLSRNNFCFNFALHSSDLDLSKDKEEPSKSGPSANEHDLYETESSCSEMGSVISKSRPFFNELNFESPIKDIFCEPDLSKFSNFITPNRDTQPSATQSKRRSNVLFAPVQTKACRKNINNEEEMRVGNKRRSRSDSTEYHSDATTLKIKKKMKKAKKKAKKKEKLANKNVASAVLPSPSEELQSMEINPELELVSAPSPQSHTENTILKSNIATANPQNTEIKSNSSNRIENLKFGPSSNNIIDLQNKNSDTDKIQTTPENSKQENSTSSPTNPEHVSSIADYYVDTYFADDCIILDEIEIQNENPENNMEALNKRETNILKNDIQTSSANIATINDEIVNMNKSISINKDVESLNYGTSENGVNFSFVDTWRKSTDNISNTDEKKNEYETISKKLKTDHSPIIHPYVVTIDSSDEDSNSSEISVGKNEENISKNVSIIDIDDNSCPDLIVANVKIDKTNLPSANKKSSMKNIVANPFSFVNTYLQNKEKKSFKDYWTEDLKQFYDESWGQEHFDVEKAQSSMSEDASDWKIIPTDLSKRSVKRQRKSPFCKRCREWGHLQFNCTMYRGPICSTCGSLGHWYTRCPQSFCSTCRNPSIHYTTKCRYCAHFRTVVCNLCYNVGHEMKYCPDLWRRYHLTTESQTELKTSSSVLKLPNERWCSNCAKRGHCEDKCTYFRHEHFPTTPGIISYVPTYDDVFKLPHVPPPPNIPIFKEANISIADLRTIKNDVIHNSNKKYMNILKQLRQQCNKFDFQLIDQIDRLRRNMNDQVFSKKQIQEIHRIRARIAKSKIS